MASVTICYSGELADTNYYLSSLQQARVLRDDIDIRSVNEANLLLRQVRSPQSHVDTQAEDDDVAPKRRALKSQSRLGRQALFEPSRLRTRR
jgi:hypothetical protein